MSILIKDMEMPERCLECPFYDNYNYYCTLYSFGIPARYNRDGSTRPEWCEIKELPECEDVVSRQEAIGLVNDHTFYDDYDDTDKNCLIDGLRSLPSAQPERENQKTALSVQVKVDFDDMKALLEDIGNLQTYKLSEDDDIVLADIEGIKGILLKHVKAKEVQPERKKGRWINKPHIYGVAYCSECDFELHINDTPYCPNCGFRMEGDDSEVD